MHVTTSCTCKVKYFSCLQDVVTDFDSHHIGVQQPHAPPQDETDTHLHNQPAPDVMSQQPSSTFAQTSASHPISNDQLPNQSTSSNASNSHDQPAGQHQMQQNDGSDASPRHRHQYEQSGTALVPHSQPGQPSSSTDQATPPAGLHQSDEASVSALEAAGAFQQHRPANGSAASEQASSSEQTHHQQQQHRVDASAETPAYTDFHPDGTPYTVHVSTNAQQQQAGPSADTAAPAGDRLQQHSADPSGDARVSTAQHQQQHAGQFGGATVPSHLQKQQEAVPGGDTPMAQQQEEVQTAGETDLQALALEQTQHEAGHTHDATANSQQHQGPAESAQDVSDSPIRDEQQPAVPDAASHDGSDATVGTAPPSSSATATDPQMQQEGSDKQAEDRGAGFPTGPLGNHAK